MTRALLILRRVPLVVALAMIVAAGTRTPALAQDQSAFAGRWAINRQASEFPAEVGFGIEIASGGGASTGSRGGGGRRGGGSGAGPTNPNLVGRESPDDARRKQLLTGEVRLPSAYLIIATTSTSVTIGDDRSIARTFHPGSREDVLQVGDIPITATARWEGTRLIVRYNVEEGRQLQYTYSIAPSPRQLIVDVQFLERGGGDSVRRVYDPLGPNDPLPPPSVAAPQATARTTGGAPPSAPPGTPPPSAPVRPPAQEPPAPPPIGALSPDGELKGLKDLGLVVEDVSGAPGACRVDKSAIETAVSRVLTDAGLRVRRNSDEDTYLYVSLATASLPSGFCVSRYDAFVYSYTTTQLSFQSSPTLVQVSLLHSGGISGSTPAGHSEGVIQGVTQYVTQFANRIRNANNQGR